MSEPEAPTDPQHPQLEVADIVRAHGAAFLARYGPGLSAAQRRAGVLLGEARVAQAVRARRRVAASMKWTTIFRSNLRARGFRCV